MTALAVATAGCSGDPPPPPSPTTTPTTKQTTTPAAPSDLEASAGLVPQRDEAILANLAAFCVDHAPRTSKAVNAALQRWKSVNAAHLAVARHYRQRLDDLAANAGSEAERHGIQELLDQQVTLIGSETNQHLDLMRVAWAHERPEVVAELCSEQFAKVTAGDWDVRRRDPEVAALLDAGIPGNAR